MSGAWSLVIRPLHLGRAYKRREVYIPYQMSCASGRQSTWMYALALNPQLLKQFYVQS